MKFNIVLLDETENWALEIAEKAGKIFGVYVYNPNEVTHCCELTPSFALYPLPSVSENYPEDEDEREWLQNEIMEGDSQANDEVRYYHCHEIDALPKIKRGQIKRGRYHWGYITKKQSGNPLEDFQEHWAGNPDY